MNNEGLERIVRKMGHSVEGRTGYWQFKYEGHLLMMITDETHNRMRIITPVAETKKIKKKDLKKVLKANFHTALDVKYAISDGILWSVFIHPLKELAPQQVVDAIKQVQRAAATYGSTYSSTDLFFPGNEGGK